MKQLKSKIATILMAAMMLVFSMNTPVLAAENDAEYDDVAISCDYELPENNDSSSIIAVATILIGAGGACVSLGFQNKFIENGIVSAVEITCL